jgi:SPP1 family phage portal protein
MSNITQMDLIKADIEYGAKGTTNKDITKNILNQWRGSQKIKDMMEADMYYKVQNTSIDSKTRSYRDDSGALVTNDTLSNVKSKTSKYRKQVRQKVNFAMNKPFVINCDDDKYKEQWDLFLNRNRRKVISRAGKQAISKGIAWCYPWIDENGDLQIVDTISETIYPAWSDTAHTKLDAVVRDYIVTEYINMTPQDSRIVEFWDNKIMQKFIDYSLGSGSGDLVDVNIEQNSELSDRASVINTHMTNKQGEGISWDRVPFIPFKGVDDELPALNECRSDVDNYDLVKSKGIDSILDDIDAVLVVKNISAELSELTKARKIVQNSRIVSVESDGDAHFEKVDANIEAIRDELDLIKKDIINDTNTVDLTSIEFASNPSGKAMRMFFEPLNEWANGFEEEFRVFMENLKYFFDKWLSWKGGFGTFEELQQKDIDFTLDRDLVVDESEIIDNIVKLENELSQETRDELNPYVDSHEQEEERREEDRKKQQEQQELFQFETDVDETEEENIYDEENNKNVEKEDKKDNKNV